MKSPRFHFSWILAVFLLLIFLLSCGDDPKGGEKKRWWGRKKATEDTEINKDSVPGIEKKYSDKCPLSPSWIFPVGRPVKGKQDTTGYFKYRGFLGAEHLGEDWNYRTSPDGDMGHIVYASSDGVVFVSDEMGPGWGKVIRILHNYGTEKDPVYAESVYAHLSNAIVKRGYAVKKGWPIGTMGNADGRYHSHLHFEIRTIPGKDLSAGIKGDTTGFVDPTDFIMSHP